MHATAQHSATALLLSRTFGVELPDSIEEALDEVRGDRPATIDEMTDAVMRAREREAGRRHRSAGDVAAMQRSVGLSYEHVEARLIEVRVDGSSVRVTAAELEYTRVQLGVRQQPVQQQDPLVLDLDGDGIETTGVEEGVSFDLDGDGVADRMSSVTGGDAFLVHDRDGDGIVRDGTELIGDHHGAADGIAELARYDDDGDGRITAADAVYARLGVWRPGGQLQSLADAGIRAIDLARQTYTGTATGGDRLVDTVAVETDTGTITAADAWLQYTPGSAA